ncbi:hypothetical protein, partial [[Mycoplasma] anseris]
LDAAKTALETKFKEIQQKAEARKQQEKQAKEKLQALIDKATLFNKTVENTSIKNELNTAIKTATAKKDDVNSTANSLELAYNELSTTFDAIEMKQNEWKMAYDVLNNKINEVNTQVNGYNLNNIERQQLLTIVSNISPVLNNKDNDANEFKKKLQELNNGITEYKTKNDIRNQINELLSKLNQDKNNEYVIDKQELQNKITKLIESTNALLAEPNSTLLEFQNKKSELENLIKETNNDATRLKVELRSTIETTLSNTKDSLTLSLLKTYPTKFNLEAALNEKISKLQPVFDNTSSDRKTLEDALRDYNTLYDKAKTWFELLEKYAFMKKALITDKEHLDKMGKFSEFEGKVKQIKQYIENYNIRPTTISIENHEAIWKRLIPIINNWFVEYNLKFNEEKTKQTYAEWIKILNQY